MNDEMTPGPAQEPRIAQDAPPAVPGPVQAAAAPRVKRVINLRTGRDRITVSRSKSNQEFAAFGRRMLRAYAKRAAQADPTLLAEMVALRAELDEAMVMVVAGLRRDTDARPRYSWREIARELGKPAGNVFRKYAPLIGEDQDSEAAS